MKTILLIEDNNDIRENTAELIELSGYNVIPAANGKRGLELARQHRPDIVLCDIFMPVADGYSVLRGMKDDPELSHIPFIFLTASVEKKEVENGMGMGAQGYISKPFDSDELFSTISGFLNGRLSA
ncbi:MAG: response regulator [Bacteroidetes bacterium]|nr:response regulator [Bacteroidota bacterium]